MSLASQLRLMVIADASLLKGRDALEVCRRVVAGGATMIQVRWKSGAAAAVAELTRALVAALTVPVIVNDRLDVALVAGAAGAHLGWDDLPLDAARRLAPPPFILGLSVGTPAEVARARGLPADYWSIGPCYATATKPDAGPPLGVEGFRAIAAQAPPGVPVIGIGGITGRTAPLIRRAGAAGVAAAAAVLAATDPAGSAAELMGDAAP
jgi:thiamine-phosphate pyrophosphorylase